jgi:hypothetical protein
MMMDVWSFDAFSCGARYERSYRSLVKGELRTRHHPNLGVLVFVCKSVSQFSSR